MDNDKFKRAYNLKLIADEFNNLSDYEKYIKTSKKQLDDIYQQCINAASNGIYSIGIFITFRYNSPNKEYIIKYFKDLYYDVELYEPGLINEKKYNPSIEELEKNPYRQYILMLKWG